MSKGSKKETGDSAEQPSELWKLKERLWNEVLGLNLDIKNLKTENTFLWEENERLRSEKGVLEEELEATRRQRDEIVGQRDAEVKESLESRSRDLARGTGTDRSEKG